jgi:Flp pilus assembly protein TadD
MALHNLALAHFQRGRLRRARRYGLRARQAAPDDEQIAALARRLGLDSPWRRFLRRLGFGKLR